MSIFTSDELGCGVFGGTAPCGGGAVYALSHARAAHLFYHRAPVQDLRGELHLSYIGLGLTSIEMQPQDRAVLRQIHGVVVEVGWIGFTGLGADLMELDRVYFQGQHLEIVQVAPWPTHLEIMYRHVGR
jgi:hypothetical protein